MLYYNTSNILCSKYHRLFTGTRAYVLNLFHRLHSSCYACPLLQHLSKPWLFSVGIVCLLFLTGRAKHASSSQASSQLVSPCTTSLSGQGTSHCLAGFVSPHSPLTDVYGRSPLAILMSYSWSAFLSSWIDRARGRPRTAPGFGWEAVATEQTDRQ